MDRARFFEIIDSARSGVDDAAPSADAEELRPAVDALDDAELLDLVRRFDEELARLNRWSVWEAGYVATGGMSADAFHGFRAWLIGKGAAAVDGVLEDPDSLADLLDGGEDLENAALESVALDLVDDRGLADPRGDDAAPIPDDAPEGAAFDPAAADEHLPRLAAWRDRPAE